MVLTAVNDTTTMRVLVSLCDVTIRHVLFCLKCWEDALGPLCELAAGDRSGDRSHGERKTAHLST